MALWDRLRTELDRAGRVAQTAFDEGRTRLELARVRQLADRAAQALGYAVFNARREDRELDADSYARLSSTLAAHQAEIERLEEELRREAGTGPERPGDEGAGGAPRPGGSDPDGSAGAPGAAGRPETAAPEAGAGAGIRGVSPAMGDDPGGVEPRTS